MKNIKLKIMIAFLISFTVLFAYAVTEQWRNTFTGVDGIIQVVADGKGGCAVASLDTNGIAIISWYNKKGDVIYQSDNYIYGFPNMIQACSKNQLTYMLTVPVPMIVQVDKKGAERPVAVINGYLYSLPFTSLSANANTFVDKKGFFVVNANTNTKTFAVVRYTYK